MQNLEKIPTVDLSVFFNGDEQGKRQANQVISEDCTNYGSFLIVNHGVPLGLLNRALEVCQSFFALPNEVKLQCRSRDEKHEQVPCYVDFESVVMLHPQDPRNVLPDNPRDFRLVMEELFKYLRKTGEVVERILNDCLGLPPNFLTEYNSDRSLDLITAKRYLPASGGTDKVVRPTHEDASVLTLIFQDEVGSLEVFKYGQWIPVAPCQGSLLVNIGDVIQVLTNTIFKSAAHRVRCPQRRSRHALSFYYNIGNKWVEPLPHFTTHIGVPAKYRRFSYREYLKMRMRNKAAEIDITRYII